MKLPQETSIPVLEDTNSAPITPPKPLLHESYRNSHHLQMPEYLCLVLGLCIAAFAMALQSMQPGMHIPFEFHLASIPLILAVAVLFISKYTPHTYAAEITQFEHVVVFSCITASFYVISINFPLSLKITTLAIYIISIFIVAFFKYQKLKFGASPSMLTTHSSNMEVMKTVNATFFSSCCNLNTASIRTGTKRTT